VVCDASPTIFGEDPAQNVGLISHTMWIGTFLSLGRVEANILLASGLIHKLVRQQWFHHQAKIYHQSQSQFNTHQSQHDNSSPVMADKEALTPRVFIVRHGETEWAKQGRQTGKTDIELTSLGIKQVVTTASHLVGEGKLLDPTKLARVFVSPRKRAQQTLQGLLGSHLDAIEARGVEITATEDVAEWDYGKYEGLKLPEIRERRKEKGLDGEGKVWNVWRDGCEGGE